MRHHTLQLTLLTLLAAAATACGGEPKAPSQDMAPDLATAEDAALDLAAEPDQPDSAHDLDPPDSAPDLVEAPLSASAGQSRYALVGEEVVLDGSGSTGAVSYQWTPGGGLATLPEVPDPVARVTYTTPGRHRATITARDSRGLARTAQIVVSVTLPITRATPRSSSVAYLPGAQAGRGLIAALSSAGRNVSLLERDGAQLTLRERIALPGSPRQLAASPRWLAITTRAPDALHIISLANTSHRATLPLPHHARPHAVIWRHDQEILVTLQGSGELARVAVSDAGEPTLIATLAALPDARGVTLLDAQRALVTRWRSDAQGGHLAAINLNNGNVEPWLLPIDPRPSSDTTSSGVPNYLDQLASSPTEPRIMIPSTQANIVEGMWRSGGRLAHDTQVRAVVTELDARDGTTSLDGRKQFDGRGLASAAVFTSRGDYLFVVMRGARTIERVDILESGADSGTIFEVGYAPQGIAISDDDHYIFVDASLSRELVVYDTRELSAPTPLARIPLVDEEPLAPIVLRGEQLFNDSFDPRLARDGYIACAHCHLEGESDGLVWDFMERGEGLRNTTSLLGRAGSGHGPIHWSGNFDEPQDFEHDIREHFGGTGLMSDADYTEGGGPMDRPKAGLSADLDALAAYMNALDAFPPSPHRLPNGELSASALRGQAIFESEVTRCTTCHSGERLTDSAFIGPSQPLLHDVGTLTEASGGRLGQPLTGIDTPTLYELWNSAPYLHDGSAATVREVFTSAATPDAHGVTSHLSDEELNDLVLYLLSL